MNPSKVSSALGGALWEVSFGELAETILVFVVYRTRENRSSEIEVLPAVMQEVLDQHNLYSYTRCALSELNTDTEAMRTQHPISWYNKVNFPAKTLLDVILPSLVLTPRKLGTTRLWTLTPTFRFTRSM